MWPVENVQLNNGYVIACMQLVHHVSIEFEIENYLRCRCRGMNKKVAFVVD